MPSKPSSVAEAPEHVPLQKKKRGPKNRDQLRVPNPAIKHVRKAMRLRQAGLEKPLCLTQAGLGKLLGLTQSYVANIETGRFPTTMTFAVKLAGKSGADVNSIVTGARIPLDTEGREYTEVSYLAFREARQEMLNQVEFGEAILPIEVALHAAADIGRRKVFTNILNATLGETIRAVEGLEQAFENRLQEARRLAEVKSKTRPYTYGELRKNTALARSLGFVDIPERGSGDIALEIRVVESTGENGQLRWSALFGGKSAMTEKDMDYLQGLIKGREKSSSP